MGLTHTKTSCMADILRRQMRSLPLTTLVVGCGNGEEAATLAEQLGSSVIGIDLDSQWDAEADAKVQLRRGDATAMEFKDGEFGLVYCYHVLEHISRPEVALQEIARVLAPGGTYWIGTPNRTRLIGYISCTMPLGMRIRRNILEVRQRLKGRFRNECGAHAGFSRGELEGMLRKVFPVVEDRTLDYYLRLYHKWSWAIRIIEYTGLGRVVFPSVYFAGRKERGPL